MSPRTPKSYKLKDLPMWSKSMALLQHIYDATDGLTSSDDRDLADELRRVVGVVPSDIAAIYGKGIDNGMVTLSYVRGDLFKIKSLVMTMQTLSLNIDSDGALQILRGADELLALIDEVVPSLEEVRV